MSSYTGSTTSTYKYDQYGQNTWNHAHQHQTAQHDYDSTPVSPTQSAMYYRNQHQHAQPYGRAQYGVSTESTGTIQTSRMRSGSNASSLTSGSFNFGTSPQGQFSNGYQNQNQYIPTNKGHSSVLSTTSNQSWSQQSHHHHHLSSQAGSDTNSIHSGSIPVSARSRSGSNNSTVPPARPPRPSEELNLDLLQQQNAAQHPHHHPQQDYFGAYGLTQQQVEQQPPYRPTYQSRSSSLLGNAAYLQQSDQSSSSRQPRQSSDILTSRPLPQLSQDERVSMESSHRSSGSGRRGGGGGRGDHHPSHHHSVGVAASSDHEQLPSIDQYEEMLQKIASPPLGPSTGRGQRRTEQDRQASRAARQARKQQQQARHQPDLILEAADEALYLDPEVRPVIRARSPNPSSLSAEERKLRRRSSLPAALRTLPASNAVEELKRRSSGGISPKEIAKVMEMRYAVDDNTYGNLSGNSRASDSQNATALDSRRSSGQRRSWEIESVVARSDIIEGLERTSSWRQRPAPDPKPKHDVLATDIYGGTTDTISYVPPPPPSSASKVRRNSWDDSLDNGPVVNGGNSNLDHGGLSLPPTKPLPPAVPPPPPSQPMPPPPAASMYTQHHHGSVTDLRRNTSTSSVASIKNHLARSDYRNSTDLKRQLLHASDEDTSDGSSMPQHYPGSRRESQQPYGSTTVGSRSSSRTGMREDMVNGLKTTITPPQKSHLRNSYTLTPPSPDDEHPAKHLLAALAEPEHAETTTATDYMAEHPEQEDTHSQPPMTPVSAPLRTLAVLAEDDATGFVPPPPLAPSHVPAAADVSAVADEDDDDIRQFQLQLEQLNSSSTTSARSGSGGRRSREEARSRHARHDDSHAPTTSAQTIVSSSIHEEGELSPLADKESSQHQPLSPSSPTMPRRPLTPTSRSTTPTPRNRPTTPNSLNNTVNNNSNSMIRPPLGPAPPPSSSMAASPVMRKTALPRTTATISLPPPPQSTPPSSLPPPPPSSSSSTTTSTSNTLMAPVPVAGTTSGGRSRAGSTASVGSTTSMDRSLMATTPPPPLSPLPSLPPPPLLSSGSAAASTMQARRTRKMSVAGTNKDQMLPGYTSDGSGGGVGSFVAMDSDLVALAGDLASAPLPPLPMAPPPPSAPLPATNSSSNSSSKSLRHQRERTHDRDSHGSNSSTTMTATTTPTLSSSPSLSSLSSFTPPSQSSPSTSSASSTSSPQQVARLKQRVHSLERELETAEHQMTTNLRDSADLKTQMTLLMQERDALQTRVAALEEEKAKGPLAVSGESYMLGSEGHDGHHHDGDFSMSRSARHERRDSGDDASKNSMLRIATLEIELESLQQTRVELERELALVREDKDQLQEQLANAQYQQQSVASPSSRSHADDDPQEEALHLLRQQLRDVQAERDAETAQREALERELEKAQQRSEQEEQQYRALQESLKRQSAHVSHVEKQHAKAMEEVQAKHQRLLDQMVADHADALTRLSIEHEEETQQMMAKLKTELETMEQQLAVQREVQQQIQGQVQRDNLLMEKERDEARWRAKFLKAKVQDQLVALDQLQAQVERLEEKQQRADRDWEDAREDWQMREQELEHRCQAAVLEARRYQRENAKLLRIVQNLDLAAMLMLRGGVEDDEDEDMEAEQQQVRGAYEKQQQEWQDRVRSLERRLAHAEQEANQEFESNLHRLVGLEYSPLDSTQEESV
ncbi:hypothetical protein BGZ73_002258 [Actinomortierella ambigua]|nr:hypothetical protein BGZ73_002258 [Actinomortierella ambigua]